MTMRLALTYGATLVLMLALDACFLGLVAVPQFRATLGDVLLDRLRFTPAILFYLLYAAGLLFFVSQPAGPGNWGAMIGRGALFGFLAYATYDLTNYATLRPWTLQLVLMDLVWGTCATAIAATGGSWLGGLLTRVLSAAPAGSG